jgi:hypothetical protein
MEPEFECFGDTPFIFTVAATSYSSNPRDFLRRTGSIIDTFSTEPEFKDLAPYIFMRAALRSPSDPRAFLRKEGRTNDELIP